MTKRDETGGGELSRPADRGAANDKSAEKSEARGSRDTAPDVDPDTGPSKGDLRRPSRPDETRTSTGRAAPAQQGPQLSEDDSFEDETASDACCAPVSEKDFDEILSALAPALPLCVAVSGGGDSVALMALLAGWLRRNPPLAVPAWTGRTAMPAITVVTVDHGLRTEAEREAAWVGEQAAALGLAHETLTAQGLQGRSNLQARARAVRYDLLETWCREHGVPTLLTGHTLEDQAETVLMRLMRGSGVDGLSGIPERTLLRDPCGRPSVEVLRPLLQVSRCRLRMTLEAAGQAWLEDPSNDDVRFTRVRVRRLLETLAKEGVQPERLAATATRMARARQSLDESCHALMQEVVTWHRAGFAWIVLEDLEEVPQELVLRMLRHVLQAVGGADFPPDHDRLLRLAHAIGGAEFERARTLSNCRIAPVADGTIALVTRENRHLPGPLILTPGDVALWDGRFQVSVPRDGRGGEIRPLGRTGLAGLKERPSFSRASLPAVVRSSLPALWDGTTLLSVPQLGLDPGGTGFQAVFTRRPTALVGGTEAMFRTGD